MKTNWQGPFQRGLSRVAHEEYKAQRADHLRKGRSPNTFRYFPPDWHRDAVEAMGNNDEEAAKAALWTGRSDQ